MPDIVDKLFGMRERFIQNLRLTATRINSRNASTFWESGRNSDFLLQFLRDRAGEDDHSELKKWIRAFENNKNEAALEFWYEIHKGIHESLREFDIS
jgi:glyceraldehyde-3-phosphate dehydrogenase (ferredoxin)